MFNYLLCKCGNDNLYFIIHVLVLTHIGVVNKNFNLVAVYLFIYMSLNLFLLIFSLFNLF